MEPGVLSLGYSVPFGLLLSKGRTFPFFHLVLSLLVSQSYLGCCYLKEKPFLFFYSYGSVPLGSQSYLGCCYLKAEPFLFFTWFLVSPICCTFAECTTKI